MDKADPDYLPRLEPSLTCVLERAERALRQLDDIKSDIAALREDLSMMEKEIGG